MADDTVEKYYEDYFELFATDGWKQFVTECQESLNANLNILNCPDDKEFWKRKGLAEAYTRICNLEGYIRAAHELGQEDANSV